MHILTKKTDAMRRILHLVSHRYTNYSHGEIELEKIVKLSDKFNDLYGIYDSDIKRYRNKKNGFCNSKIVFLQSEKQNICYWWLLATNGKGKIYELEKMLDAKNKKQRIISPDGSYELVKTPRKELKASWTWKLTNEAVALWEDKIKATIRSKNDALLKQMIHSIRRTPGFRESRKQAFLFARLIKNEWHRHRTEQFPYPDIYIGFLGRYKAAGTCDINNQ
jgi:hypothetical protein